MKIQAYNMLPVVIMLILASLTLWLRQAVEFLPETTVSRDDSKPDAIAEKLSIVRLGPDGKLLYSMTAGRLLHFDRDNVAMLESPRFDKRDRDGVRTAITATRGRIAKGNDEAFFYGDVRMTRTGARRDLQARTEFLHVIPSRNLILSDRQVTLNDGTSTLTGVGLEINKATGQISLKSQVKGSYHAARKQ